LRYLRATIMADRGERVSAPLVTNVRATPQKLFVRFSGDE
jgi:hypothetical protein